MLTSVHKESEEKVEKRVARCPSPNHRRLQVIHSREHPAFFDKSEFRYATAHAQCKPGAIIMRPNYDVTAHTLVLRRGKSGVWTPIKSHHRSAGYTESGLLIFRLCLTFG